jgi:hypothetical protein
VFGTRPEVIRKFGRSKLRWEDGVIQDTRQGPGSEELVDVTMKTEDWLELLKKARLRTGLSSQ